MAFFSFLKSPRSRSVNTSGITLWGHPFSPYVRKVRLVLAYKEIAYNHPSENQVLPIATQLRMGKVESELTRTLLEASPLGRIPVIESTAANGERFVMDESSIIVDYLEERFPSAKSVYPRASPEQYARARWWEQWVDTRLSPILHGVVFIENFVKPVIMKAPTDDKAVASALVAAEELFKYLEEHLKDGRRWLAGGDVISIGDMAFAALYANHERAKWEVDPLKYPKLTKYCRALMDQPFIKAIP